MKISQHENNPYSELRDNLKQLGQLLAYADQRWTFRGGQFRGEIDNEMIRNLIHQMYIKISQL